MQAREKAQWGAFYAALSRQASYLAKRWRSAAEGLPRFEALTGLVYAGISLIGMEGLVAPASAALAAACEADIDAAFRRATRRSCWRC